MEEQSDILNFPQSLAQSCCIHRIWSHCNPLYRNRKFKDVRWLAGLVKIARTVDNDYAHLSVVFHFFAKYCCVAMPCKKLNLLQLSGSCGTSIHNNHCYSKTYCIHISRTY